VIAAAAQDNPPHEPHNSIGGAKEQRRFGGNPNAAQLAQSCPVTPDYMYFEVTFNTGVAADDDGVAIANTAATVADQGGALEPTTRTTLTAQAVARRVRGLHRLTLPASLLTSLTGALSSIATRLRTKPRTTSLASLASALPAQTSARSLRT
jgi:hypothetical protein